MGFDHMTVQPTGDGDRFFTAVPSETESQRADRLKLQAEKAKRAEVARLELEIVVLKEKLATILATP